MLATTGFLTALTVQQVRFQQGLHPGPHCGELVMLPQTI